jgi:hypothetical protein
MVNGWQWRWLHCSRQKGDKLLCRWLTGSLRIKCRWRARVWWRAPVLRLVWIGGAMWWLITRSHNVVAMADKKPNSWVCLKKSEGRKGTYGEKRSCSEGAVAPGVRTWWEQAATTLQRRRGPSEAQSRGVEGGQRMHARCAAMSVWAWPVGQLLLGPTRQEQCQFWFKQKFLTNSNLKRPKNKNLPKLKKFK